MDPVELIRKKRDGGTLTRPELESLVDGYVRGEVPDYQMAAFLMAVYFAGMNPDETLTFTSAMLHSGEIIDLSFIPGRKVDKHSTGGVGDKVSLILAPMVAACGVPVPMISGRGLAHTGGTIDKLHAIPGFRTDLSVKEYKEIMSDLGLVLAGQTSEIAPADRTMYALRDVTATVESIPLIAGSILSKKLAEGIDALVLDVKTGNGAFMNTFEKSVTLASTLVSIGNNMGRDTIAFITDMTQPLGLAIGNWREVVEAVDCLRGKNIPDLMEVTTVLGGAMVYLGGKAESVQEGMRLCRTAIWSGKAYEKFLQIVERQGGNVSFINRPQTYPQSTHHREIRAARDGYVIGFDTRRIGLLAVELGAGRKRMSDVIDPKAGILLRKKLGDSVKKEDTLADLWTERDGDLNRVSQELTGCIHLGETAVPRPTYVHAYISKDGLKPWEAIPPMSL